VTITPLSDQGKADINELLGQYIRMLAEQGQTEEATSLGILLEDLEHHFVQIIPVKEQADPSVSTE
jgi:glutamate synthase (NADPH) large chain